MLGKIKNNIMAWATLAFAYSWTACDSTTFQNGKGAAGSPGTAEGIPHDPNNPGTDRLSSNSGAGNNGSDGVDGTQKNNGINERDARITSACPDQPQLILILDFKSGWWAGDGGAFFNRMLGGLSVPCASSVKLEYHHIVGDDDGTDLSIDNTVIRFPGDGRKLDASGNLQGFDQQDWNGYTQIWLLSGSQADPADIPVSGPFFSGVLQKIIASKADLFIGGGYGTITHGNVLTSALGLGNAFATDQQEGRVIFPDPVSTVVTSKLMRGVQFKDHPLFDRGVNSLADSVTIDGDAVAGDSLINNGQLNVLAVNAANKPCIAGVDIENPAMERRIVLDAGLQRYYSIMVPGNEETLTLMQNIIIHLSR